MKASDAPLVSVITPCYNGEQFAGRYFETILEQIYPKVELFFVNDGSTDATEEIAISYKDRIEAKGYTFYYIYKENSGAASALNAALPYFSGKYLTWPDSDDIMTPDCIQKKVEFLENHPECSTVCFPVDVVSENDLCMVLGRMERKGKSNNDLFEDYIRIKNVCFTPIHFMIRSDQWIQAVPTRRIWEGKHGQNFQMLLPVLYQNRCGFGDDVVGRYVIRDNSDSQIDKNYDSLRSKLYDHESIVYETLRTMKMPEKEKECYQEIAKNKYRKARFELAIENENVDDIIHDYQYLCKHNMLSYFDKMAYWKIKNGIVYFFMRLLHIPIGAINQLKRKFSND